MRIQLTVVAAIAVAVVEGKYWNETLPANSTTNGTIQASAACSLSTSTIYIPFTETITSTTPVSDQVATIAQSSSSSTRYSTVSTFTNTVSRVTTVTASASSLPPPAISATTATATVTATVSVISTVTASLPLSPTTATTSSGGPSYSFYVTDGSTVWQDGISPSSGASLQIVTTSVVVTPIQATSAPATSTSSTSSSIAPKPLTTFTPPAYSSTTFSVLSPALTTTLTSTHFITRSLSQVSPPASASHASFTGMNSAGWNASSTQPAIVSSTIASAAPRLTKFTRMVYFGHDDITTSTSTQLVTATIGEAVAQIVSPSASNSDTGAASSATISPGEPSGISYSTSISFSGNPTGLSSSALTATVRGSQSTEGATLASSPAASPPAGSLAASSDEIHQTIGATNGQSPTSGVPSVSSYSSPIPSSASNVLATTTTSNGIPSSMLYTITTFFSGKGTTITVSTIRSASTPRITVVNGTTYDVTTSTVSRPSANSTLTGSALSTRIGSSVPGSADSTQTSTAATGGSITSSNAISSGTASRSSDTANPSDSRTLSSASTTGSDRLSASTETSLRAGSSTAPSESKTATNPDTTSLSRTTTSARSSGTSLREGSSTTPSESETATISYTTRLSRTTTSSQTSLSTSLRPNFSPSTSRNSTATAATASPTATCGEQGDFTMDFDTLDSFGRRLRLLRRQNSTSNGNGTSSGGNGTTDITQQPPMSLRPYKHMLFSGGYVYAPQPIEPFAPASPPNVAAFLANSTGLKAGPGSPHGLEPGEIADGPYHDGNPAFFFDARSAALGCDSQTAPCTMEVTGYTWNGTLKDDVPTLTENYTLPACENYRNCKLTPVDFPPTFRNLSGIRLRAVRGSEPRTFFVDDIKARWSDSSCAAGNARKNSQ